MEGRRKAAAALKTLGGDLQGRLVPSSDEERERAVKMGLKDPEQLLTLDDLVKTDDVIFAATGITTSNLLRGVRFIPGGAITHTVVMRGLTGTVRFIEARHRFDKKPQWQRLCPAI